ncbi:MAG: FadR family transcriptional regulator [Anaerolineales bacterium]|nr:FadR family transcriptional regulator [Anaerolineales bacterium]
MSDFDLIKYLSRARRENGSADCADIPSLQKIGKENRVSIAKLREQLSVARSLGFVDVQPHHGITLRPYSFTPAVKQSLSYALSVNPAYFQDFSALRIQIEANNWYQAVEKLTPADIEVLQKLVDKANAKLSASPPQLPHAEHRALHMTIYSKLENVFVVGLLEAYWDAYEAVGLNQYTELAYLKSVWQYHSQIVQALAQGDFDQGYRLLLAHMDLIKDRNAR